jgi:hypothetical protein
MLTNIASRPAAVTLNIGGTGNSTPTFQGLTDLAAIKAAKPGWTVTANLPLAVYDGDLGITLGTGVSAWADQSGQGDSNRNALQATAINQPSYTAIDADFNGHGSIQGGDGKCLKTLSFIMPQPLTIYCICKFGNLSSTEILFDNLTGNTSRIVLQAFNTNNINLYAGTSLTSTANSPNINSIKAVISSIANGGSSSIFVNNSSSAVVSGNAGAANLDGLTLLANYPGNVNLKGKLAYIAIYPGVHTTAQRTAAMTELATRFGITLV